MSALQLYNGLDKTDAPPESKARLKGMIVAYENVLEIEPKTF